MIEKDRKYIWHPFTQQKNMADPIAIIRGEGTLLIDADNNTYIDAISSWWVNLHGHAHPYIAGKLYQQAMQLEQVIFAGFTHQPAIDLAERLIDILPGNFAKIFYSDNGSTSTEVALKMAVQYWWNQRKNDVDVKKKNKLLALKNAYHGDTFGAMSVSERSVFTMAFHDLLFEVIFIDAPAADNIEATKELIASHSDEIAAFIYEPLVQGAGGIQMYEATMLDELLSIVQQHDIICIADEVMTGFGRTGKLFCSEYMQNKPDIICLSKGLTGGTMALGVTACTEKIYNAYVNDDKLKTFFHGHSFTANPLACTAALASLDLLLKEECLKQIDWLTEQNKLFAETLLTAEFPVRLKNIRTQGTILAFEIAEGKDEYLNNVSTVFTKKALAHGIYLRPLGNTVYIMPPYCITEEEYERVKEVIIAILIEN
ncbi:adenosylmethionine--8-amino-7-oxononanoate transaminase [Danxiaibacter flavus]|uniref:Adenosylmethionine-8-amino-7-oxononanoate aminotransferase n=1 Tax=Danxiaibacter flavus TaxID=3049108 RepID=A0ABV3ZH72_9BACT|nr:adenosylmethionine--8-amino-7-oxononanoate transaminase [Chitinophagaceae bacterium DXS]